MKHINSINPYIWIIVFLSLIPLSTSCQTSEKERVFTLKDYLKESPDLSNKVEEVFNKMDFNERAAQMIITAAGKYGKEHEVVKKLVSQKVVGGVLLLNGTKDGFSIFVNELNQLTQENDQVPMLFSADAEPSLINRKISGTKEVKKTSEIIDEKDCKNVATQISNELLNIGINQNFAPVIDISLDNEAIGNRSFGNDPLRVINLAMTFMETSHNMNIVSTIKHFPGHGRVSGDTHKKLVYIDGDLTELENYVPFIDNGALSIMVAHLAIENNEKYNTNGAPSTCSRIIVSDLLRNEMGFKGIIITDAMNMGALSSYGNAPLEAAKAGCDMILMPPDEVGLHKDLSKLLSEKSGLRNQLDDSVKRIIRLKICLGLL